MLEKEARELIIDNYENDKLIDRPEWIIEGHSYHSVKNKKIYWISLVEHRDYELASLKYNDELTINLIWDLIKEIKYNDEKQKEENK